MPRPTPALVSAWATCPRCNLVRNLSSRCPCRSFREVPPPRWQMWCGWCGLGLAYGTALGALCALWC